MSAPTAYLILHPESGIFLGHFLGLGIWSKIDPCGQTAAVTFASPEEAEGFMATWDQGRPPGVTLAPVELDGPILGGCGYATLTAIVRAGLEPWLDDHMTCVGGPQ